MTKLIKSELQRLITSKKNKILFVISILIFFALAAMLLSYSKGFYDMNTATSINQLNFSVFMLREFHIFFVFVMLCLPLVDCFNSEFKTGSLRMYLIRPFNKSNFMIAKLISTAIVSFISVIFFFVLAQILGNIFAVKVSATSFFNIRHAYNFFGAFIYSLQFYFCEWLIILSVIGVIALIGIFVPNAIITYLLTIAVLVGSLYASDMFNFFLVSSKIIFDVMAGINNSFWFVNLFIIIVSYCLSVIIFEHRDYLD